jgi:lipopolysaccharide transport system ATP-binding protein
VERLGLIGHNGAGKLYRKILNGLINPMLQSKPSDKGRVSALIELGAGFNPILSGRKTFYNNGAVLGFSKRKLMPEEIRSSRSANLSICPYKTAAAV